MNQEVNGNRRSARNLPKESEMPPTNTATQDTSLPPQPQHTGTGQPSTTASTNPPQAPSNRRPTRGSKSPNKTRQAARSPNKVQRRIGAGTSKRKSRSPVKRTPKATKSAKLLPAPPNGSPNPLPTHRLRPNLLSNLFANPPRQAVLEPRPQLPSPPGAHQSTQARTNGYGKRGIHQKREAPLVVEEDDDYHSSEDEWIIKGALLPSEDEVTRPYDPYDDCGTQAQVKLRNGRWVRDFGDTPQASPIGLDLTHDPDCGSGFAPLFPSPIRSRSPLDVGSTYGPTPTRQTLRPGRSRPIIISPQSVSTRRPTKRPREEDDNEEEETPQPKRQKRVDILDAHLTKNNAKGKGRDPEEERIRQQERRKEVARQAQEQREQAIRNTQNEREKERGRRPHVQPQQHRPTITGINYLGDILTTSDTASTRFIPPNSANNVRHASRPTRHLDLGTDSDSSLSSGGRPSRHHAQRPSSRKPRKPKGWKKSKRTLAGLTPNSKETARLGKKIYVDTIMEQNAFMSEKNSRRVGAAAFKEAQQQLPEEAEHAQMKTYNDDLDALFSQAASSARGSFKSAADTICPKAYKLRPKKSLRRSMTKEGKVEFTQKRVEELLQLPCPSFTRGPTRKQSAEVFANPALMELVATAYYGKLKAEQQSRFLTNIPPAIIALAATAMQAALEGWERGNHHAVAFTEERFGPFYQDFLAELEDMRLRFPNRYQALLRLYAEECEAFFGEAESERDDSAGTSRRFNFFGDDEQDDEDSDVEENERSGRNRD